MKKKLTAYFLVLLIIISSFISSCSFLPTITTLENNNKFTKKSIPDSTICSKSNMVGISVSKNVAFSKNDSITITTNIPLNLDNHLKYFIQNPQYGSIDVIMKNIKYIVKIKGIYKDVEKEVQVGCNSFDWDLKDVNNLPLPADNYSVKLILRVEKTKEGYYSRYPSDQTEIWDLTLFGGTTLNILPLVNIIVFNGIMMRSDSYYCYEKNLNNNNSCLNSYYNNNIFNWGLNNHFLSNEELAGAVSETSFQITEGDALQPPPPPLDPATTRFFEVEDFKKLSDYANQLNISDDMADALYTKIKGLEILETQKSSLLARNTPPIAKIQEIDNKIAETNAVITSLQSSLMVALSDISNKNNTLVNQVNAITQTQYITPYPPEEKPTSVGGYFDSVYFADQDLSNILTDGVTLYSPDPDDPIQDDLKEAWQVSPERVEVSDPSQVFDGSKYLTNEIQTAKDLMTDYLNGVFDASGNNGASEKSEAISVLKNLVTQIKTHTGLLKTKAKIYHDDLSSNFEKLKEAEAEQFQSIILPLANAMEQEGDYADDTYIKNVQSMTIQSFRTMDFKAWQDWAKTKYNLGKDFWNSNLGKREKVIAIVLGYTLDDWNALKKQDPKAADELVVATSELIEAVGIPTSYTSVAITFAGPIAKFTGKIGKIASKVLGKKLPPNQAGYIKKLLENIKLTKEKVFRWISKTPASVKKGSPCFNKMSIQSFNTKGNIVPCPVEYFQKFSVATSLYKFKNGVFKIKDLTEFNTKYKTLVTALKKVPDSKIPESNFKQKILETVVKFKNNGVKIKNYGHPNFNGDGVGAVNNYVLHEFNIVPTLQSLGKTSDNYINGVRAVDFEAANRMLAKHWYGVGGELRFKEVSSTIDSLELVWHHNEDLKSLQLIPRYIHDKLKPHVGSVKYVEVIRANKNDTKLVNSYFNVFIK